MNNSNLITVTEYAKLKGKSYKAVETCIRRGRLHAEKIDGIYYIDKDIPYPQRVRYKDITGQRFGKLVAIKYVGKSKADAALWECVCDCGSHKIVAAHRLKIGDAKSCGCAKFEREGIDIRGKKFGRLTAIEPTEKRDAKGTVIWECSCDCGKQRHIYVPVRNLNDGTVTSCGCKKTEAGKKAQPNAVDGAKRSPNSGRFETNVNAKEWELVAPDGREYKCINLNLWAREHTELFDFEPCDHSATKIAHGFQNIAATYRGTRTGVYTYKRWTLRSAPCKPE